MDPALVCSIDVEGNGVEEALDVLEDIPAEVEGDDDETG